MRLINRKQDSDSVFWKIAVEHPIQFEMLRHLSDAKGMKRYWLSKTDNIWN